jgi:hypothetical protein
MSYSNLIPIMTSNTTPSGIASSSALDDTFPNPAWQAMNNDTNSVWLSKWDYVGDEWIQYQFPSAKTAVAYGITYTCIYDDRKPTAWVLEGSDNGSSWTTLDTRSGISWTPSSWYEFQKQDFVISVPQLFIYYRLRITAHNNNWTNISEFALYEEGVSFDDSLSLSDSWDLITTYEPLSISDSLSLHDDWLLQLNPDNQSISDSLSLNDSWSVEDTPKFAVLSDSLSLNDSWTFFQIIRKIFNTDLRWRKLFTNGINLVLNWILTKRINTDLRWLGKSQTLINTDLRWLTNIYTILNPIAPSDTQIFINGTDILLGNDIDIESGNIIHTVGQNSQASFVLARKHDDLDRTHLGVASQITNQNPVQIYIDGHLEFDGYIMTINVASETETVSITAQMVQSEDNRHSIELPLPSVNELIHPYHCLVNNVQIDNPKEDTRAVIIGSNNRYWNGTSWVFYIEDAMIFTTDVDAQNYIDSYVDLTVNLIFESKKPSVTSREKNPQYYKGVKVNLGLEIKQQIDKYRDLELILGSQTITIDGKNYDFTDTGVYAAQITVGTFITKPNYSYFWAVLAKNIRTGLSNVDYRYIGTSLGSIATDLWVLQGVTPMYQKIKPNIETELGYYYLGSAPYKEISPKNGRLIVVEKWQDRNDGLYNIREESYNFVDYAKLIANLEYEKLQNINGNILPISSASIDITFDAYYYYNVKLLTRVNVTNTTVANTYNNLNGFPVSVKGISINFKSMKVTLSTDNKLSQIELDEIEQQMPDEESSLYVTPENAVRVYRKFDLKTWSFVS